MTVRPPSGFPLPELVTVASRVITSEADALRAALEDFSNAPQLGCPWNQDDKTVSDHANQSSLTILEYAVPQLQRYMQMSQSAVDS